MQNFNVLIWVIAPLSIILGTIYFVEIKRHDKIFIPNVKPREVFHIFGNFTNFFILEPHLIRFKLKAEFDGEKMLNVSRERYDKFEVNHRDRLLNSNHSWSYVVWYEEYYQHLPSFLTNKNLGHYIMSQLEDRTHLC